MREIFVEKREELIRIAVKENDELVECLVEEKTIEPQIGEVYKGRVKNIIPAINSIFLDIGLEKEAYMYYSEELKRTGVKKGQELLVEVLKEPLGNKGAKVSNKVNILGRYIVLTIGVEGITISKRISDMEQRQRLINLTKPIKGIEIVYRTEAETATDEELLSELNSLLEKKEEMENKIATLTAGRAAEEVAFGQITTGASNDIEQATKLARSMITQYGMSNDFGMVAMETVSNQYLGADASLTCSPETLKEIDRKVIELIGKQHEKAIKILESNRTKLDKLAQFLYEKETITGEEFMKILKERGE